MLEIYIYLTQLLELCIGCNSYPEEILNTINTVSVYTINVSDSIVSIDNNHTAIA